MAKQYLFYDLKASGKNHAFDQIFRFAAILTDDKFNEIEEYEYKIKILPDVTCSPKAMIKNMLSFEDIQKGLNEYDAIVEIHRLFNTPNTVNIGFNSLRHNDNLLKFAFYRNLLSPYTHQWENGCHRGDMLPITLMYYIFKNDFLEWPIVDDRVSFRLEHLNKANNLYQETLHNALTDVRIAINLAKKFFEFPDLFYKQIKYFINKEDFKQVERTIANTNGIVDSKYPVVNLASVRFGSDSNFASPVLFLGSYSGNSYAKFLRLDNENLDKITLDNIAETTWIINKKYGDNLIVLPDHPKSWELLTDERKELVRNNLDRIMKTPGLLEKINEHYPKRWRKFHKEIDLDVRLHEMDFLVFKKERKTLKRFHQFSESKKQTILNEFSSSRLKKVGNRLMARNFPEETTKQNQLEFEKYLEKFNNGIAPIDFRRNPKRTKQKAIEEIIELLADENLTQEQREILIDYKFHLEK